MVEEIEKVSTKADFNSIDLSSIDAAEARAARPSFAQLLDSAISIDSKLKEETQKQPRLTIQMTQTTKSTQQFVIPPTQQVTTPLAPQKPVVESKPQQRPLPNQSVKEEIDTFASRLNKETKQQPKRVNTFNMKIEGQDDLILLRLSVSDQITELERIIEGIREHVFDKYHIQIVKKEVTGLNKEIAQERAEGAEREPMSLERSLAALRDQRLKEVMALLSGM